MASQVSTASLVLALGGTLDLNTDTLKMGLLKNTYTPNADHNFVDDVAANECDATNYTPGFAGAGRKTLTSPTVTEDTGTNRAVMDAADTGLSWTAIGGASNNTLRYAFVCKEVTNDAASPLIAVLDFGADKTTNGGDFTVTINASGIFYIST